MSSSLKSILSGFRTNQDDVEQRPLRSEIFSVERLEQYAQTLAAEHKTIVRKGQALLLPRLESNARKLESAYRMLVDLNLFVALLRSAFRRRSPLTW